jgi:hypothetical protein
MRGNPVVTEFLIGITRPGKAQLEYLGLLLLQALLLVLFWPQSGVAEMLESQHSPDTLAAVMMAIGVTTAYFALRAGAEEILLPGQHGLRDWARATPLGPGRIVRGYLVGQLVHSLHLLALSAPLLLIAFTVSGGEWAALTWCMAAALLQALFYRLCGAIAHLTVGHYVAASTFVWTILLLVYAPVGWLAPVTSHVAFTSRALGETMALQPASERVMDQLAFLAIYGGLGVLAALALHRLLLRERRRARGPHGDARLGEAATS